MAYFAWAFLCALLLTAHGFCPPVQTACGLRARTEDHGALCGGGILGGPHARNGRRVHGPALRMHACQQPTRRRLLARLSSWAAVVGCAIRYLYASAAQGEPGGWIENVLVVPLQECGGTCAC